MSLNLTQLANDLAFMVADLPDSIVMDAPDGRTFACSTGQASKSKMLKEEGFLGEFDLNVTIQNSLIVAPIVERQIFTHTRSGLKFRVSKITDSQDSVSTILAAIQVTG